MNASTLASAPASGPNNVQADRAARPGESRAGDLSDGALTANSPEQALVPASQWAANARAIAPDGPVAKLPVELEVGVPLRDFRVQNLLSLESGSIVESRWVHGDDVPLAAGKVQLAWAEFEVMDAQLAVRVTRLA